jgi:LCP family protein required for cell wall assembly
MSELRPRSSLRTGLVPVARHGRLKTRHPIATLLKFIAGAVAVVLVSSVSVAAFAVYNISTDFKPSVHLVGETDGPPPAIGDYPGGFNVLLAGTDDGSGDAQYGKRGENLNDVTMLLHVSEDHTRAIAISFPRDLIVSIPACPRSDGKGNYSAMSSQMINNTLEYGGLACTVLTVENLTGLKIPFAGLIGFNGVVEMSNAIGGVPVCANAPIIDKYSGLNIPAGTSVIQGAQALAFLRSRHGVGDGSDLGRISSQQVFLSSLVRTIRSGEVLTNPVKLYGLAHAAASNIQLSASLNNPSTLVAMGETLRKIPPANITFVQYPSSTGLPGIAPGRVGPLKAQAAALLAKIKADEPFAVDPNAKRIGAALDPNAPVVPATTPTGPASGTATGSAAPPADAPVAPVLPGLQGQTADQQTCSVSNHR